MTGRTGSGANASAPAAAPAGERRRGFLDDGVGERRGVVLLNGRPERLVIERSGEPPAASAGARVAARLIRIDRRVGAAFVDLGDGLTGLLPLKGPAAGLTEGVMAAVEVLAGPRQDKAAAVRFLKRVEGRPGLLTPPPPLEQQLRSWISEGGLETGSEARDVADEAEAEALALEHSLPSGGRLCIEPTRALTAVDVDLAGAAGGDPRRLLARVNAEALSAAARLLRLKALGGLVAVDLAGRGHDGAALTAVARAAFAPDGPEVSIGAISRFGVLELSLPWRRRPIADVLLGADGRISAFSVALRLVRRIESQALPGERVLARCAPEVARASEPLSGALKARIGARFTIEAVGAMERHQFEVHPF